MLAAFTELKQAEMVKQFLLRKKILHPDYLPVKELDRIYFPITKPLSVPQAKIINTALKFPLKPGTKTIEGLLEKKLTKAELCLIPHSLEIVGSIIILEIPPSLVKKEKIIEIGRASCRERGEIS